MSDDSKELSRVEDILSGEDYLPKKPMSRVEELLMDGAMVPKVDDTDNGKVLKVIDGEWQPGEDVSGDNLPPVSSLDNGKVLKVVSGEWNIGDDKSESSFVYISSSYPFSGSKVALPANINSVLIANYTSSPKVPTFLVTSNNVIFEPKEVDISTGTTPSVHIRWGRMYSTFDSATREQDIYNDSLSYNTQNQTTEASYFKTKAIQTIPPVDIPDSGKVMQVGNGGTWQANYLPEVDGVPQVTSSDVGKVLKATAEGEYDWGDASRTNAVQVPPVIYDNGELKKMSVDNFPGVEQIFLTPTAYSNLTTTEKEDLSKIYYVSDYEFHVDPDHPEVVVRIGSNNDVKWFFSGYTFANNNRYEVPESLRQYQPNNGTGRIRVDSTPYASASSTEPISSIYFVGWSNMDQANKIRYSSITGTSVSILNGTVYAVIDVAGGSGQTNPYFDPYDIPNGFTIYYGNKQYTNYDIPDPLPDVDSSDNGKVLKVVEGAWAAGADEGGSEAVYKTLEDYEALTTAQKEDPTKIYFVKDTGTTVSETKTQDDGTVTASAVDGTHYAWYVFDAQGNNRYWSPSNAAFSGSWFKYEFANKYTFTGMDIWLSTWDPRLVRVVIEASNDNSTWTNITQNEYYDIETVRSGWNTTGTKYSFILNANTIFKYVRVTFSLSPASQTTQKETALYVQHCDIKAATDARPKIYYKNVLYTPDELPAASTTDVGKALVVNSDGVWDKGDIPVGSEAVYKTLEEYEALTTSEKEDPTKIYFVINEGSKVSPTLAADDGNVAASSSKDGYYAWKAFSGSSRTDAQDWEYAWESWGQNNGEWISYTFSTTQIFSKVSVRTATMQVRTMNYYVEGSNDGTNWTNLIPNGIDYVSVYQPAYDWQSSSFNYVTTEILLDTTKGRFSKIRFRTDSSIAYPYSSDSFVVANFDIYAAAASNKPAIYYKNVLYTPDELPIASISDAGKILAVNADGVWDKDYIYRELTQQEYDALPSSKNSDGIIYFITDNS